MKIHDIIGVSDEGLVAHLELYIGRLNQDIADWEFTAAGGELFTATITDLSLLNTAQTLSVRLLKYGDDFLFCFFTAIQEKQKILAYFPGMAPPDKEDIEVDTVAIQSILPDLQPVDMQWLYLYCSSENNTINASLWQKITARSESADLNSIIKRKTDFTSSDNPLDYLEYISWAGNDHAYAPWQGGFYYFGKYDTFPFADHIPELKENPGFLTFTNTIVNGFIIHGCISYPRYFPYLNFQVPLVDLKSDFLSGSVQFHLSAPSKYSEDGKRVLGFSGKLDFGDQFNLKILGEWPYDGDIVTAKATGLLKEVPYINGITIPALDSLPPDYTIDIDLQLSKKNAFLRRIHFGVEVERWYLHRDIFLLEDLVFAIDIVDPGGWNIVTAGVKASVLLGKNQIRLICTGSYPEAYFSFELDPNTPIHLDDMMHALFDTAQGTETGLEIKTLYGDFSATSNYLSFRLTLDQEDSQQWKPGGHDFVLENLSLGINGRPGALGGYLSAVMDFKALKFSVSAVYDQGWAFSAAMEGTVKLTTLLDHLGAGQDKIPGVLRDVEIGDVTLYFNTHTKDFEFTGHGQIELNGQPSVIVLHATLKQDETGHYEKYFSGQIIVGESKRQFDLIFDSKEDNNLLLAVYQKPGGEEVTINALISAFSDVAVAADLKFSVKNAMLVLDKVTKDAKTINKFLFTSEIDFGINLSALGTLPIVGQNFSGKEALSLAFQPIISSKGEKKFEKEEIEAISKVLMLNAPGSPPLPDEGLGDGGVGLIANLRWGELTKTIQLGLKAKDVDEKLEETNKEEAMGVAAEIVDGKAESTNSGIKWIDLKKNFGAVNISRVGLGFNDGTINVKLDGGLAIGPLEVALAGLGANYTLKTKTFDVTLDGLGLRFKNDPIEISGSFLHLNNDYVGRVTIKAESFAIMALGAFSEINGKPSFFLYAYLDYPLGGPAFFFVEGLALGFGYNRRLVVPPIEELRTFPLISEVIGESKPAQIDSASLAPADGAGKDNFVDNLRKEFETLGKYIYPQEGQYFIAVGIKFNSFKTLDSFALLTIGFGQHLDFGLMGISKLTVPAQAGLKDKNDEIIKPVAEVEMAFSVRFDPEEGFLAVQAILTPNSYILSGLCRIQGGFAFFSWFKGPNGGDFVVTLGGYHPNFAVPAHYPQPAVVPRLTYSWRLSDDLLLKGSAYFALTPKAMMMGGRLEASYKKEFSSFRVAANFTATADFLVFWKPFHYIASASVEISCSLTLLTFLGEWPINLSAGASIQLWGPPFGGTANVHLRVIGIKVEFTVDFGGGSTLPDKLSWTDFKAAFLPPKPETSSISLAVQNGLVQSIKQTIDNKENEIWIINPKEFKLAISTAVPLTSGIGFETNKDIVFIDPVVPASNVLDAAMTIVLKKGANDLSAHFSFIKIQKLFPKALWTNDASKGATPDINSGQTILLTGGYLLVPKMPPTAQASRFFEMSVFEYEQSDNFQKQVASGNLSYKRAGTLTEADIATTRTERKAILEGLGFVYDTSVDLHPGLVSAFVSPLQTVELV